MIHIYNLLFTAEDPVLLCDVAFHWPLPHGNFENYYPPHLCRNIRIFNGCQLQIENTVTRVTVRHHKAYRGSASQGLPRFGIMRLAE